MKDIIKSISKGVLKLLTKFFNLTDLNPEFNSSQGAKLLIKLLLIKVPSLNSRSVDCPLIINLMVTLL